MAPLGGIVYDGMSGSHGHGTILYSLKKIFFYIVVVFDRDPLS